MGLLDDAIREHLELKRLRGADPGEVARAEKEALDPVSREEVLLEDAHESLDTAPGGGSAEPPAYAGPVAADPQETAELDMNTLFESAELDARPEQ